MPNQHAFIQFLLVNELLHILCHNGVVVLLGMERVSMIPEVLSLTLSLPANHRMQGTYQSVYLTLQVTCEGSTMISCAFRMLEYESTHRLILRLFCFDPKSPCKKRIGLRTACSFSGPKI